MERGNLGVPAEADGELEARVQANRGSPAAHVNNCVECMPPPPPPPLHPLSVALPASAFLYVPMNRLVEPLESVPLIGSVACLRIDLKISIIHSALIYTSVCLEWLVTTRLNLSPKITRHVICKIIMF